MKVRWRDHEMLVVTILILWQIARLLLHVNTHPLEELQADYASQFKENGIPFIFVSQPLNHKSQLRGMELAHPRS